LFTCNFEINNNFTFDRPSSTKKYATNNKRKREDDDNNESSDSDSDSQEDSEKELDYFYNKVKHTSLKLKYYKKKGFRI